MKPVILYYGTSLDYSEQIDTVGFVDKVCLTTNLVSAYEQAIKTIYMPNSNCLQPVICVVNLSLLINDGFVFEHNDAEYYLANVPAEYITQFAIETEEDLKLLAHYAQEQVSY